MMSEFGYGAIAGIASVYCGQSFARGDYKVAFLIGLIAIGSGVASVAESEIKRLKKEANDLENKVDGSD